MKKFPRLNAMTIWWIVAITGIVILIVAQLNGINVD